MRKRKTPRKCSAINMKITMGCAKKKNKKKGSEERRVRWVRWEIDAAITTPKSLKQQ